MQAARRPSARAIFLGSIGTTGALAVLAACERNGIEPASPHTAVLRGPTPESLFACPTGQSEAWRGTFEGPDWLTTWQAVRVFYGQENASTVAEPRLGDVLRVRYPAGSSSSSFAQEGHPVGGLEFKAKLPALDALTFAYWLRFAPNFPWVKGGKLPGVCGGSCPSGGKVVTGMGGWSLRLMWRPEGQGEEYAYILPAREYGTELGLGTWTFQQGDWHRVVVQIVLNEGGRENGASRVWYDADPGTAPTFEPTGLTFRKDGTPADTLFFSTFFGGHDASWATPVDTYVDFAGFVVCR